MLKKTDMIYIYDGSFNGFLCCAFESFTRREIPNDIINDKSAELGLFENFKIPTDDIKAERVVKSIVREIGDSALYFLKTAFCSSYKHKELLMLDFMRLGYAHGAKVIRMLGEECVLKLHKIVREIERETDKYKGFLRFGVYGNFLAAKIKPKNFVIERLALHFIRRMPAENFIIYDETYSLICVYAKNKISISEVSDINFASPDKDEVFYQNLWKMFYNTAAVEGRENLKLRQSLMPKRYWSNLTEFSNRINDTVFHISENKKETLKSEK